MRSGIQIWTISHRNISRPLIIQQYDVHWRCMMIERQRILYIASAVIIAVAGTIFWLLVMGLSAQSVWADPGPLYVAPSPTGDDNNPCSSIQPCATVQHAVDLAETSDEVLVATGVYTGVQARDAMTQVVYISKTVTIRGGYNSDFSLWDPDTFPSTLDAEQQGRVVYISGASITPTLESLTITGGDATGLTTHCPPAGGQSDGCGGGIFVYNARPTIMNNIVTDNVAAVSTNSHSASGGGICASYATGTVILGNLIFSNTASTGERGMGGGIHLYFPYEILVESNQILSNTATTHDSLAGWGGGIAIGGSGAAGTIVGNHIQGNRTNGGGYGYGAGIYQWSASSNFASNQVMSNYGSHAVYLGYSHSRFDSNQVVNNDTSTGIQLVNGSESGLTMTNNIIANSGDRSLSVFAYDGAPLTATLIHNTVAGSGTGYGVIIETGYVTLTLTNTIVTSHTWGITNTVPASSTIFTDHTLFWANQSDGIRGANPVDGDPDFIDPNTGNYHIGLASAAIDAGIEAGVNSDLDGDSRPHGSAPDIGADEAMWWRIYLPLVMRQN